MSEQHSRSVLVKSLAGLVRNPTMAVTWFRRADWRLLYYLARGEDFTEANKRRMNARVESDPSEAIGGFGRGIGELQLEFLQSEGLSPTDTLLDIGCGTLRGGRYFIDYLNAGNYIGMDISAEAIRAGKEVVGPETLDEKRPELFVNSDLKFREVDESSVDMALTQSVFTHIPPENIRECFAHIGRVLTDDGALYATFYESEDESHMALSPSSHFYPRTWLVGAAAESGLSASVVKYDHPNGQEMLKVEK